MTLVLLALGVSLADPPDFRKLRRWESSDEIRGGGLWDATTLFTWGDRVRMFDLPRLKHRVIHSGEIGEGGCIVDVNGDGQPDLVLHERSAEGAALGRMIWLEAPEYNAHLIDTDADFSDCLGTKLFGKPGVLVLHRYSQVRFYEIPAQIRSRWPYRELYSIYTPSTQGGLLRADVNGDGHEDILAGNYWLQSPADEESSWRLFPINNWWDDARAALLRTAWVGPILIAAQRDAEPGKLGWFSPPREQAQLWTETRLDAIPPLRRIQALAAADVNGDGLVDIVAGENVGPQSRLMVFTAFAGNKYQGAQLDVTDGLSGISASDFDGDGEPDLVGIGPRGVTLWRNQRRK